MAGRGGLWMSAIASFAAAVAAAADNSALALPWRSDGLCGPGHDAPDGTNPARCNPWDVDGKTCCSAEGVCVESSHTDRCRCANCTEYAIRRAWRNDGRCGDDLKGGDGIAPAICHPLHPRNITCCSEEGFCGAWPSYAHCRCHDCVNHHTNCGCAATPDTPCQDAASGRCYPRTLRDGDADMVPHLWKAFGSAHNGAAATLDGAAATDSNGRPIDPRHIAANQDRRPELDPRRSMRMVAIEQRFDKRAAAESAAQHAQQQELSLRPMIDSMRCGVGLVDCVAMEQERRRRLTSIETFEAIDGTTTGSSSNSTNSSHGGGNNSSDSKSGVSAAEAATRAPADAANGTRSIDQTPLPKHAKTHAEPPPDQQIPIRLAGADRPREGRVEVFYNGTWGSICGRDDGWTWSAAHVACVSLGYGGVETISDSAAFGLGTGPVWLSHLDCNGHEPRLEECGKYFEINSLKAYVL